MSIDAVASIGPKAPSTPRGTSSPAPASTTTRPFSAAFSVGACYGTVFSSFLSPPRNQPKPPKQHLISPLPLAQRQKKPTTLDRQMTPSLTQRRGPRRIEKRERLRKPSVPSDRLCILNSRSSHFSLQPGLFNFLAPTPPAHPCIRYNPPVKKQRPFSVVTHHIANLLQEFALTRHIKRGDVYLCEYTDWRCARTLLRTYPAPFILNSIHRFFADTNPLIKADPSFPRFATTLPTYTSPKPSTLSRKRGSEK